MSDNEVYDLFPFLTNCSVKIITLTKDTVLFNEGEKCGVVGFLIKGKIRVYKGSETGREITLYRISQGESCILSIACILSTPIHSASAIVEEDTLLCLVTANEVRTLLSKSNEARDFVFSLFSGRLAKIMALIEDIVFQKLDKRLAKFLLNSEQNNLVHYSSHETIATELGTSREVITRLLKDFEQREIIKTSRGVIVILHRNELKKLLH